MIVINLSSSLFFFLYLPELFQMSRQVGVKKTLFLAESHLRPSPPGLNEQDGRDVALSGQRFPLRAE